MPNVGKPSKGCKNCRDRKVKCDQKRPSCSQCIRTQKECHGYRDPLSMMFKNESEVVVNKAQKRYEELSKQRQRKPLMSSADEESPRSLFSGSDSPELSSSQPERAQRVVPRRRAPVKKYSMVRPVAPSVVDQAVGFFFSRYVVEPSIVPRGHYDFLIELLRKNDADEVLQRSVNAVGLATLANSTKSCATMKQAHDEYGKALTLTNKALRCRETAIQDSTLIAVMVLGLFENVAYCGKDSLKAWARHTDGASALLLMRGEEQFKTELGRKIIHQFYGVILLVAMETGSPVPQEMTKLWYKLTQTGDYRVHGKHWTVSVVHFIQDTINLNLYKGGDPIALVEKAMKLDLELDKIRARIPPVWNYETVSLEKPAEHVFDSKYHIYMDPWIAQMWNNVRACRIFLHEVIRANIIKGSQCNPPLFPEHVSLFQVSASDQVIRATADDVCASAPQIFGQLPFPVSSINDSQSNVELVDPRDPTFRLGKRGAFLHTATNTYIHHLVWPLYAVGSSDVTTPEMRQWVIDALLYVALKVGTRQAAVFAKELQLMYVSNDILA